MRSFMCLALALVLLSTLVVAPAAQEQKPGEGMAVEGTVGTAFTYQGRLTEAGSPASGVYDLQFKLYAASEGGSPLGEVKVDDVAVVEGLFTVLLNFGSGAFAGEARYLEIGVQPGSGGGGYTILTPRQALTPTPYAMYATSAGAAPWAGLSGVPPGLGDGDDDSLGELSCGSGQVAKWNGSAWACGADEDDDTLGALSCGAGQVAKWDGRTWVCAADDGGGGDRFWSLGGNSGTTPGSHYLGTTDYKALEVKVDSERALRLEPSSTSPNLVGGFKGNQAKAGVYAATIGGGGANSLEQRVTDHYGTVSGGGYNQAGDGDGVLSDAAYATVGGGWHNVASGARGTVGGGNANLASGQYATVAGGGSNQATGYGATVGGGGGNQANATYATVAGGGRSDASKPISSNRATDRWATVGGGGYNQAGNNNSSTTDAQYATVGGGYLNRASGAQSTVSGGADNTAGYRATVAGGLTNKATGKYGAVPGGYLNVAGGDNSFAAGRRAKANHAGSFVWADSTNADFVSKNTNEFAVRANGGVRFVTDGQFSIEDPGGDPAFTVGEDGIIAFPGLKWYKINVPENSSRRVDIGEHAFCALSQVRISNTDILDALYLAQCTLYHYDGRWELEGISDEVIHCDAFCF